MSLIQTLLLHCCRPTGLEIEKGRGSAFNEEEVDDQASTPDEANLDDVQVQAEDENEPSTSNASGIIPVEIKDSKSLKIYSSCCQFSVYFLSEEIYNLCLQRKPESLS